MERRTRFPSLYRDVLSQLVRMCPSPVLPPDIGIQNRRRERPAYLGLIVSMIVSSSNDEISPSVLI